MHPHQNAHQVGDQKVLVSFHSFVDVKANRCIPLSWPNYSTLPEQNST